MIRKYDVLCNVKIWTKDCQEICSERKIFCTKISFREIGEKAEKEVLKKLIHHRRDHFSQVFSGVWGLKEGEILV